MCVIFMRGTTTKMKSHAHKNNMSLDNVVASLPDAVDEDELKDLLRSLMARVRDLNDKICAPVKPKAFRGGHNTYNRYSDWEIDRLNHIADTLVSGTSAYRRALVDLMHEMNARAKEENRDVKRDYSTLTRKICVLRRKRAKFGV